MSTDALPPPLNQIAKTDTVTRTLNCGETLFAQNNPTAGLFFLETGTIDLKRTTLSGHSITIHRARASTTFAEASLFTDRYHCTATAVSAVKLIECKRPAISHLLNTDIKFANTMAARFASQIQESRRHVELLSIRAAGERIVAALDDGLLVEDVVTFADVIGLAPATVYRTLARLTKEERVIKTARGEYQKGKPTR